MLTTRKRLVDPIDLFLVFFEISLGCLSILFSQLIQLLSTSTDFLLQFLVELLKVVFGGLDLLLTKLLIVFEDLVEFVDLIPQVLQELVGSLELPEG